MQPASLDPKLKEWATESQARYIDAVIHHGSIRAASRALGVGFRSVHGAVEAVKNKAALAGFSPQHYLTRPVAPGLTLRGTSQLYRRGEAEPVLEWVKTRADDQRRELIIREAVGALMNDVPRAEPTAAPEHAPKHLCNVFTFTDSHVGMHAWGKQTGADWDLPIAEATLVGVFQHMVNAAPKAETAVVVELGDFLHFDSLIPETPTNHHPLDADSRYGKVVRVATRILRAIIDLALKRHTRVRVVIAEGNHDLAGSVWLRHLFSLLYENEPRVQVIDSELPYYVHQHGTVMLGWHHGHLKRKEGLPLLFAAQFPQMWGATRKRYIHTGHLHHVDEKEHAGAYVIQHPTLAARDAYSARGGWISERHATAITYHASHGEVARNTVTPEMLA